MEGFVNLAWLLPIPPFLAFLAIILFLNRNKTVSALTAILGAGVSWLIGWPIAFAVFLNHQYGEHPAERRPLHDPYRRLRTGDRLAGGPGKCAHDLHGDLRHADDLHLLQRLHDFPAALGAGEVSGRVCAGQGSALQPLHGVHQPLCHRYAGAAGVELPGDVLHLLGSDGSVQLSAHRFLV